MTDSTKSTDELESIKAKLIKKTEEINFLKIKNSNLQDRIIKLENIPSQVSLQERYKIFLTQIQIKTSATHLQTLRTNLCLDAALISMQW